MGEFRRPRKIRNTGQILLEMVLFEAEFIEGFVKTKTSKNERALAEKFFPRLLKISDFGQNAEGQFWLSFKAEFRKP